MTYTHNINTIIEKRQPFIKRIQQVIEHLKSLQSLLIKLETRRQELLRSSESTEVATNLQQVNFTTIQKRIEKKIQELSLLKKRFDRGTINIGVVGLMGQGKSTFLKTLSQLSDLEIPALKGQACTAVRSTIYHDNEKTGAIVTFHDEESFFKEIIISYYQELELTPIPTSLDEFANRPLPPQPDDATKKAMYQRFNEYYVNFTKYRHLLSSDSPRKINVPKEKIRDYVAHHYDSNRNLISYEQLAVKEVEIYCHFNKAEVEKIGLVDIPGLGDLRVGDEGLMLKTIAEKVDVVIFIRRPDPLRYGWTEYDTKLYDKAKKALNGLEKRAFMVLNRVGDNEGNNNYDGCIEHQKTIKDKHIEVEQCLIADCSDPVEADKVLDLVLKYLVNNIEELDKNYSQLYQKELNEIYQNLEDELKRAIAALVSFGDEGRLFKKYFEEFIKNISNNLVGLLERLRKQRNTIDKDFQAEVDRVLKACTEDPGIPSPDKIRDLKNSPDFKGSFLAVYQVCVAQIRTHLSKHFLSLNLGLKASVDDLKCLVAQEFTKAGNGYLGELTSARNTEFLAVMADMLKERQNRLELGFRKLSETAITYEGSLLHLIRQNFDNLLQSDINEPPANPTPEPIPPQNPKKVIVDLLKSKPETTENYDEAKEIKQALETLHKKAIDNCKQTLDQWVRKPSSMKYYIVEEFIDRILYTEGMKQEWEIFLEEREIRSKVWSEFRKVEERKKICLEWNALIQQTQEINTRENMQFVN